MEALEGVCVFLTLRLLISTAWPGTRATTSRDPEGLLCKVKLTDTYCHMHNSVSRVEEYLCLAIDPAN